jgi:hypothetical protein
MSANPLAEAECIHGLEHGCTICLHGPTPRNETPISQCRSCDADIIWVVTEKGKKMPLDAEPHPEGTFRKERVDANGDRIVHFVTEGIERADNNRPLYQSHFATCPERDHHRKPR